MFRLLQEIERRPNCFEHYTAADLWTDEHTSSRMLAYHLDGAVDISSRKTESIDRAVSWMVTRFALAKHRSVADFGCGPGLYTIRLAASGASVTGIDFSGRSIRYARDRSLHERLPIDYVQANYLQYQSDQRFDLIVMIMCDYCALSPTQRKVLRNNFRAHLKPGGALLLDVFSWRAFAARQEHRGYQANPHGGFWSADPYYEFLNTFKYDPEHVVLDKYTIVEEQRVRTVYNWLEYFDCEKLRDEMESDGLEVEEMLGDVAGSAYDLSSHEFAVVARKPVG